MEVLAAELVRLIREDPPDDPFTPEGIVVHHPGVGRWLTLELARAFGIAANIRFEQPAGFAWSIMRGAVPDLPEEQSYAPSRLRWRIYDVLPGFARERWGRALRGYLADGDPRKRFELADRLARVFDRCLLYRPDWIREWEGGAAPHWQARLWQGLAGGERPADHWVAAIDAFKAARMPGRPSRPPLPLRPSPPHPAHPDDDATAPVSSPDDCPGAVLRPPPRPPGWPWRVVFFAVPALSPSYLDMLRTSAREIEVHLFMLTPCREYWGDIRSRREIDRRTASEDSEGQYFTEGNELLAAWGRAGRDTFDSLIEIEGAVSEEHFEVPAGVHRLAAVQRDILELRLAGEAAHTAAASAASSGEAAAPDVRPVAAPDGTGGAGVPCAGTPQATPPPAADDSIQVHICHSPLREAEVLHDRLLGLFDAHHDLEPADVLVLTADIEVYGRAIEAVFGAAGRIPFSVARARAAGSRTLRAFLDLLELPDSRLGVEAVLAPLDAPALRSRFGLHEADLPLIRRRVREAGVRWGVDEAHRGAQGLPEMSGHTWRQGVARLLLGYAMSDPTALVAGLVPCPADAAGFEGGAAEDESLGRFLTYCEAVFGLRTRLAGTRCPAAWAGVLHEEFSRFFADRPLPSARGAAAPPTGEIADETGAVRRLIQGFENEAKRCGSPVPFALVRDVVRERGTQASPEPARLSDGVSVASLGPGRIVPAGVVCVVGMNDGAFPRSPKAPSFDVVAAGPARRGDRDTRHEDRFTFLEALLAARRCFFVSYTGRGLRDDAPIPPSVLVDELVDYLGRRFPGMPVETRHPLQPFSPRYFTAHENLFSYSRGMCEAARTMLSERGGAGSCAPFTGTALPEPEESRRLVDLDELVEFFANPVRFFLRERLGARLELDDLATEEDEPFTIDNLERYHLRSDIWRQIRDGLDPQRAAALLHGSGRLPQAGLGCVIHEGVREEVQQLEGQLAPYREALDAPPCEIDFVLDGFRVAGRVGHVGADALVWWRIGRLRARDRIDIWLRQLAWTAAGHAPLRAVGITLDRGKWKTTRFGPPMRAGEQLAGWLRARWRGLAEPLPFFPEASFAYALATVRLTLDADRAAAEARSRAAAAWYGERPWGRRGERLDPYLDLVHDDGNPLTSAFEDLATKLLVPLVKAGS